MCIAICRCRYVCMRTFISLCIIIEYDAYLEIAFYLSRWQVSRVKQGTLTLREHLVPHPVQKRFVVLDVHWLYYIFYCLFCTIYEIDSDKSAVLGYSNCFVFTEPYIDP